MDQRGYVFPETKGFMFAIQDQVVSTRNYRKVNLKDRTVEDKCQKSGKRGEAIQHVLNGCETLVTREYKERHDTVGRILHQEINKCIIDETKTVQYYRYQPESIVRTEK